MCCCRQRTARAKAFSLIELLVATALAASVMIAVLGVLTRFAHRRRERSAESDRRALVDGLLSLVETDVVNARRYWAEADGFALEGVGCLDETTRALRHAPARVVYEVRHGGGTGCLVRRQDVELSTGQVVTRRELVCVGVRRLALAPATAPGQPPRPPPRPGVPQPVERAMELTVWFAAADGSPGEAVVRTLQVR